MLKNLVLGENEIGDEGAKAIGGALAVNGVLTDLNLRANSIRDAGAAAIAEALRVNGVLTSLDVGFKMASPRRRPSASCVSSGSATS